MKRIFGLVMVILGVLGMAVGVGLMAPGGPLRSESEIVLAYMCGYRSGQVAITSRLPTLFTDPDDKKVNQPACADYAKLAKMPP